MNRCDLCTILVGKHHMYDKTKKIKIGNKSYNVDIDCYDRLKNLSVRSAERLFEKTQQSIYMFQQEQ